MTPSGKERSVEADVIANTQLVLAEREARDRGWWEREADYFHPDSVVSVSWFHGSGKEFVAASKELSTGSIGDTTKHRLAPPVVHAGTDRAVVTMGAVLASRALVGGVELDLAGSVRFLYRTERREGRWRIVSLDCIYERDTLTPAIPGVQLVIDDAELAAFRPSYRMLAWSFTRRGIAVRDDLPGDDRPEGVKALYANHFAWAGLDIPC